MFNRVHVDTGMTNKVSAANSVVTDFILSFTRMGNEHLVALHEAKQGKIGTAKPLDKGSLLFLMNEVCADAPVSNWRDPRILYQSASTLVWYRKASAKPERLWFRLAEKHFSIMAKLPTLIFMESGRELFVFAACTNQVNRTTPLYHAPFCNVYERGGLCFGSVERPDNKDSLEVRMAKLEAALLESNFSHISCKNTFKSLHGKDHDTNHHIAQWKQFEKSGLSPKAKDMVKFGLTVQQMVTKLERK